MHTFTPQIILITLLSLVVLTNALSRVSRIPSVFLLLITSYGVSVAFPNEITEDLRRYFDTMIIFCIPIIFMGDALHLKFEDLRRYGMDIFYLAVVSVAISIAVGASLHHFDIFPELGLGAYVALFAINMATDAVSVQSILSRFEGIEHKIKVLIEGESLGNDATAVIAYFFVGIPWMMNGTMSAGEVFAVSLKVFILSIAIGLTVGYLFYLWMKILEEKRNEFFSFVIEAYSVYLIAEHFHLSGILSLITAIVSTKALIDIDLKRSAEGIYREGRFSFGLRRSKFLDISATTEERMEYIYEMAKEFGYIAAVIIFFMLAEVVDPHLLIKYWREIVIMFLATTVIRALSMAKFAFIGDRTEAIKPVGKEGWFILTFSGMKGALSIILVHMLPQELPYRELFEAVTVGTVILSIFVYGSVLWFYFAFRPIGTDRV